MVKKPRNPKRALSWGSGWVATRGDKYVARWYDDAGVCRGKSFARYEDAEDYVRLQSRRRSRGEYIPPAEMTVNDLIEEWLARGEYRWSEWTSWTYRNRYEKHIRGDFGVIRLTDVTTHRLQRWVDELSRTGISPRTIDNILRPITGAFREATALGILTTNPTIGVRRPKLRHSALEVWTSADVSSVMEVIASDAFLNALYRTALSTGMRPGELRALQWPDVTANSITVKRTITRDKEGHVVTGTETKTGKIRTVAIPATTATALSAWRQSQRVRSIGDDWVFPSPGGGFLRLTTWQRIHADVCKRAGVPRIRLHGLRHTFATLMLAANVHPKIVSEMLGHQRIETTLNIYSHPSLDMQQDAASIIERVLNG